MRLIDAKASAHLVRQIVQLLLEARSVEWCGRLVVLVAQLVGVEKGLELTQSGACLFAERSADRVYFERHLTREHVERFEMSIALELVVVSSERGLFARGRHVALGLCALGLFLLACLLLLGFT